MLLKHIQRSVSEIAYASGFTKTTHLSNFFKKEAAQPVKIQEYNKMDK